MPSKITNNFHLWLAQDDHKTWGARFIDSKNLDWNVNGYWVTLGWKTNKLVLTDTAQIYAASNRLTTNLDRILYVWDNWTDWIIYKPNSTDNTEEFAVTIWDTAKNLLKNVKYFSGLYYFVGKDTDGLNYQIHKISSADAQLNNWGSIVYNDAGVTYSLSFTPHIVSYKDWLLFAVNDWLVAFDWSTYTLFGSLTEWETVWITTHWTTVLIYSANWDVSYWDWTSSTTASYQKLGFIPSKVTQKANTDYVITTDWDLYIGSGYQFERVIKARKSKRLNDNGSYQDIFQFYNTLTDTAETIIIWDNDIFIVWEDSNIYKYWQLAPWLQNSVHKISSTSHLLTDYDEIYWLSYQDRLNQLVVFYKTWSTTWVDYIDVKSKETTQNWYWVTEVFSANTSYIKKPTQIRVTASNTSWDNFVKQYIRVNDWAWTQIQNINDATDIIARHTVKAQEAKNYIDVQFKIELNNDTQWETAPIVQELLNEYIITPK